MVTQSSGVVLTIADLGAVRDEFADVTSFHRINGKPGMVISVDRASSEDVLAITDAVKEYVHEENLELPKGYELVTWGDASVEVRQRLELLGRNGLQGLVLVLLVLAIFLELKLALWVALGIPISILGTCAVMLYTGQTLNMLTTFAFLMALGIVVDDAIVIGENIFTHRQRGAGAVQAAISGTVEVLPSVLASVATTIIAFTPLMFVTGVMGKFIAVLPLAMISMLVISLIESTFILPCHLAHTGGRSKKKVRRQLLMRAALRGVDRLPVPLKWAAAAVCVPLALVADPFIYALRRLGNFFGFLNSHAQRWLDGFIDRVYTPIVRYATNSPLTVLSAAVAMLMVAVGIVAGGMVPFVVFPKMDSTSLRATIVFPDGTPSAVSDAATFACRGSRERGRKTIRNVRWAGPRATHAANRWPGRRTKRPRRRQ